MPCRLPKEIKLRNLDSKSSRNRQAASGVAEYISRLKSAGQRFRDAAHLHRKQKVEFEATAADQEAQRPAHQKLPSDGTPIGPSVPTAMPSHDLVRTFPLPLHPRREALCCPVLLLVILGMTCIARSRLVCICQGTRNWCRKGPQQPDPVRAEQPLSAGRSATQGLGSQGRRSRPWRVPATRAGTTRCMAAAPPALALSLQKRQAPLSTCSPAVRLGCWTNTQNTARQPSRPPAAPRSFPTHLGGESHWLQCELSAVALHSQVDGRDGQSNFDWT